MNYIELINRFWSEVEMKGYKSQDANLYFYLLHYCNKIGWVNPFSLPNKRAVLSTGLSEKTLIECRCRLSERGLIDFRPGKRKAAPPVYCFPIESENGFYFPWESKTGSKTESKTESKTGSYNKTINNKLKTDSVANATPSGQVPLVSPKEKKSKRATKANDPPPTFPTLDEVRRYFLSQSADTRLDDWELSARLFFDEYNSVGWKDKYGNKVIQWQGKANGWIFYRERAEKEKRTNNEQSQTYRPSGPSGGVPIRGRIVPGCGLKKRNPPGEN